MVPLSPRAGGARTEDLRALSQQNVSMDTATFKTLQREAVLVRLRGGATRRGAGPQRTGRDHTERGGATQRGAGPEAGAAGQPNRKGRGRKTVRP